MCEVTKTSKDFRRQYLDPEGPEFKSRSEYFFCFLIGSVRGSKARLCGFESRTFIMTKVDET